MSVCKEKSEIIQNALKDELFNALKSENGVLWRAKKSEFEIRLKSELSHPW